MGKIIEIKETTDYEQFSFDEKNRPINKRHVKELADSVEERNLLHVEPGVIGKDKVVIDGQHRLKVAEMLEVSYYYIEDEELTIDDAPRLNVNQFNWDLYQWENFWIKSGKKDYIELKEFRDKYNLPISVSISLNYSKNAYASGSTNDIYREGQFEMKHRDFAETFAQMLNDIEKLEGVDKTIDFAKNQTFIMALLTAIRTGEYDHEHFLEQLRSAPYMLERQANRRLFLRNIEDVYNYKQASKVRFF